MVKLRNLFKRPQNSGTVVNHEGAPAYMRSLEEQTLQVLMTNTLNDTFYASQKEIAQETRDVLTQMRDKDAGFLARALVYARNRGLMQLAPVLGLVILSTATDKAPFMQAFPHVIQTPDNLREFVAACRAGTLRQGLGGAALAATKTWLQGLSAYHAIKYSGASEGISLRDTLRLAHPKPLDRTMEERYGWLVKGWDWVGPDSSPTNPQIWSYETLKRAQDEATVLRMIEVGRLPWEVVVPAAKKMTPAIWEALMPQMPYMALLRNINTLARNGVLEKQANVATLAKRLSDPQAVARSKVLPFRFFDAYRAYDATNDHKLAILNALQSALEASFVNMPAIDGDICIGSDVSGSMQGRVSPRGATRYIDICGVFTAALLKQARGKVTALPFQHEVIEKHGLSQEDPILVTAGKLSKLGGGGTAVGAPLQWLLSNKRKVDVFIGITDNEDWAYGPNAAVKGPFRQLWEQYRAQVNPQAQAFLITIAPYRAVVAPETDGSVHFIYGWSSSVVDYIAYTLRGWSSQVEAVRKLDLANPQFTPQPAGESDDAA